MDGCQIAPALPKPKPKPKPKSKYWPPPAIYRLSLVTCRLPLLPVGGGALGKQWKKHKVLYAAVTVVVQ